MKVTHSNQTLILASERRVSSAKPDSTLDRAVNAASKGGTLKRVTIVASQPNEGVVYVHADYADGARTPAADATETATTNSHVAPANTATVATPSRNSSALANTSTSAGTAVVTRAAALLRTDSFSGANNSRDAYGNQRYSGAVGALTSYLSPTEQYARTQRLVSSAAPVSLIDVLA